MIYNLNASSLHKTVGSILLESSSFSNFNIQQEYLVIEINPNYPNSSHRFDWVILDLKVVIELHGEQHFSSIQFGNITSEKAIDNLSIQKNRDYRKRDAAISAGYTYIEISYLDIKKISENYLWELINSNYNNQKLLSPIKTKKEKTEKEILILEHSKNLRKERYQKLKKLYNKSKKEVI